MAFAIFEAPFEVKTFFRGYCQLKDLLTPIFQLRFYSFWTEISFSEERESSATRKSADRMHTTQQ